MTTAEILNAYREAVADSPAVIRLLKKSTYPSAYQLSAEAARILNSIYNVKIGATITPELAQQIVAPLMKEYFGVVSPHIAAVQTAINENIGIGITAQIPTTPNAANLAARMVGSAEINTESVLTAANRFIDNAIEQHAEKLYSAAGISGTIERVNEHYGLDHNKTVTSDSGKTYSYGNSYVRACEFCDSRAGVFAYPTETADKRVFQRHEGCHCEVTYKPLRGANQNVWGKNTTYKGSKKK